MGTVVLRVQERGVERRITVDELEERIRLGTISPEAPLAVDVRWTSVREWPAFEALTGTPEAALRRRWAARPVAWATALTVGLVIQVYLWGRLLSARFAIDLMSPLARDTTAILERGEGWRLLTSALLHSGLDHISGNLAALVVAGMGLEKLIGSRRTLFVLLVTVAVGGVLSAIFLPDITSVGISGGDFGLMGAAAVLGARFARLLPGSARATFGWTVALGTAYFFLSTVTEAHVDSWCHFGGLVSGLVLGALYRPLIPAWESYNRRIDAVALGLLVGTLVLPTAMGPRLLQWVPWESDGGVATRPAWWSFQVTHSGLQGYGNADRSSAVAIDTTRHEHKATAEAVIQAQLAELRRVDTAAEVTVLAPGRARFRYNPGGGARDLELRVEVRGLYSTVAAVDTEDGAKVAPFLVEHVIEHLELRVPQDVTDELAGATSASWKAKLAAAVARAELGEGAVAAGLFAAARPEGGASVDIAEFGSLVALGDPGAPAAVEAALIAWPEDRRVKAAAARAFSALGLKDRAGALALDLWSTSPSERSRDVARELLVELGLPVPPQPLTGEGGVQGTNR